MTIVCDASWRCRASGWPPSITNRVGCVAIASQVVLMNCDRHDGVQWPNVPKKKKNPWAERRRRLAPAPAGWTPRGPPTPSQKPHYAACWVRPGFLMLSLARKSRRTEKKHQHPFRWHRLRMITHPVVDSHGKFRQSDKPPKT